MILEIFITVAALVIALMLFLANYRSRETLAQQVVATRAYTLRRYWFWLVLVGAVVTFALTVPYFPYPHAAALANFKHFSVVAQQFSFTLPETVPLNRPVVFDVTSKDVNHGFGIYGPSGGVVSQVQAMPGYVNHLALTFTVPGHYVVRCLEYCGIAHAEMQGGFEVR
jgi:cytochrome c oxidase subunit 2